MDEVVVEVEDTINAAPERVWKAMTQKTSPMFMGATMDTDWSQGSRYTLKGEWDGRPFTDYGEIEKADEPRELAFTHWSRTPEPPDSYNLVRMRIAPVDKGSRVTLAQIGRGTPQAYDDKAKAEFRKNWTTMLGGLKKAAEAG